MIHTSLSIHTYILYIYIYSDYITMTSLLMGQADYSCLTNRLHSKSSGPGEPLDSPYTHAPVITSSYWNHNITLHCLPSFLPTTHKSLTTKTSSRFLSDVCWANIYSAHGKIKTIAILSASGSGHRGLLVCSITGTDIIGYQA